VKAGVAYSTLGASHEAAKEAAEEAIRSSGKPVLTFLFTTDSYEQESVLETVKGVVGSSKIVGFCTGGVITSQGVLEQGVGVTTLSGDELRVSTCLQGSLGADPRAVGRRAGRALLASGIDNGVVISFPDGFPANVSEATRGLYESMGPDFTYTGGGAGDSLKFLKTYQFTEAGVRSNALAAVLLGGVAMGAAIGHGWRPEGNPLVITRAKGKRVYEIDARPAFDVYSERLGGIIRHRFREYGMVHPLGFPDLSGNYLIRDPLCVNKDESIDFVTEVPENAVARIMCGNAAELVAVARTVAKAAAQRVAEPQLTLVFDCISRYILMGQEFEQELTAISESTGRDVPVLAALTFGEIGSYIDVPLFHNKTVAVAVLGSKE